MLRPSLLVALVVIAVPLASADRVEIFRLHADDTSAGQAGQVGTLAAAIAYADVQVSLDCDGIDAVFQFGFPAWTDQRETGVACVEGETTVVHTHLPAGNHAVNAAISWTPATWAAFATSGVEPTTSYTLVVTAAR